VAQLGALKNSPPINVLGKISGRNPPSHPQGRPMDLASDKRLQELNRLIQTETDPEKIVALSEEFERRLKQLQDGDLDHSKHFVRPAC